MLSIINGLCCGQYLSVTCNPVLRPTSISHNNTEAPDHSERTTPTRGVLDALTLQPAISHHKKKHHQPAPAPLACSTAATGIQSPLRSDGICQVAAGLISDVARGTSHVPLALAAVVVSVSENWQQHDVVAFRGVMGL